MSRGRTLVLILALFLVLIVVGSIVGIVSMVRGGGGASIEGGSVLVLDIAGRLPEQPLPEAPLAGLGDTAISLIEIDSALKKAAVDDRIDHVLVRPGGLAAGYSKVLELRAAMRRFSEQSDKPITCWMEAAGNKEYLLATGCDSIYMAPEGLLFVNGLNFGVTFYKGTLDKLGVEAEFTRAGKYKSAIEPMTSKEMSPAFRATLEVMADDLFGDFVDSIAEARQDLDAEAVRALVDDPPMTASAAVRAGLVDGLFYRDQLVRHLAGESVQPIDPSVPTLSDRLWTVDTRPEPEEGEDSLLDGGVAVGASPTPASPVAAPVSPTNEPDPRTDDDDSATPLGPPPEEPELDQVTLAEYRKVSPSSLGLGGGPKVAVVYCEGSITSGASNPGGGLSGQSMGSDTIARAVRRARKNESVKAIVLRVDSPGGSGLASDIIWREVELARRTKPVVVSMSDYAASGGYYISMAADVIVAEPTTLTGSIGVFGGKYNLAGLYEKLGMNVETVKRGEFADLFSASRPLGESGVGKLQQYVDAFYETFLRKVGQGRGMSPLDVHEVAQGRVWTGRSARALGLVDELGTFRDALRIAKEKAGIDGEASLVLYPRQPSFWEQLLDQSRTPGLGSFLGALDRSTLHGQPGLATSWRGPRQLIGAAGLFATGEPVLMTPWFIEAL